MPALIQQNYISIPDYLAGEAISDVKHESTEHHSGLDSVISLSEIKAALPLADIYDRVELTA